MITALWEGIGGWHWSLDTDDAVYSGLRATEAEARAEMDGVMRDLRAQDAAQVDALRARAEAAEAEAKDACTAADEAEHRASLAIDSAQELARCVLQATQSKGSWVDHPPMGDWAGVVDGVSALRARAEAAEQRAETAERELAQARADARVLAGHWFGAVGGVFLDVEGLTAAEAKALDAIAYEADDLSREAVLAVIRRALGGAA